MIDRVGKAKGKLPGLRRRAEVVALTRAAARLGLDAWIVGGALRDRLLGLASPEIDVAVARDAEGLAHALEADGLGRAVFLSKDRPGPRVFRVAGRRQIDIAEIEGSTIGTDLARRDFTVNALALPLGSGELVDPFGGVADVLARRLRCVKPENLLEDPLRILRAARLWATLGLEPVPGVLRAARAAAHLFGNAAPERISAELSRLLGSEQAAPALGWASRAGILDEALGLALPPAKSAAIARRLSALDGRSIRGLSPARRRRLRLAFVAIQSRLAAPAARHWLGQRRWAREEARDAAALVALAAPSARLRCAPDRWRWVLDAGGLAQDALVLLGALGAAGRRRAQSLAPLTRKPPRQVAVGGDDVVRWLEVEAGPRVGELLAALRVAAAMGEVKNRREARHWLTGQVRKGP
jgi:Poly A polymerase head domain